MSKHILVIDDDLAILEAVEILLKEDGYQVTVISDAKIVIKFLEKQLPDLILLDLLLSGEDGRDLARKIKVHPVAKKVPIILMSADTHIQSKSQEAQADDFLKKPFNIEELEALLQKYLR